MHLILTVFTKCGGKQVLGVYGNIDDCLNELGQRFGLKITNVWANDIYDGYGDGYTINLNDPHYTYATLV